ncbi:MAG: hypothetical protein JOY94_13035 [Methylobacteriaceae bacterium]|nr:hypothetical protein [Methylobacteriaceae bacterium]
MMDRLSTDEIIADALQPECSFCGLKPPDVRLGAGPNVFICNKCVSTFGKIFEKEEKTRPSEEERSA